MKLVSPEVFYTDEHPVKIDCNVIEEIKAQAARNPRRRARLCTHKDVADRLHEMFIVMARDVYVHPHKHFGKSESFHVIEGSADVLFFNEEGEIDEVIRMDVSSVYYLRNDDPRYHSLIVTSEYLVVHEITNGPFDRTETEFAPWAPPETDVPAVEAYYEELKRNAARW